MLIHEKIDPIAARQRRAALVETTDIDASMFVVMQKFVVELNFGKHPGVLAAGRFLRGLCEGAAPAEHCQDHEAHRP
ncbi:hypothetical protein D3C87_1160740 [compost metagenome]